MGTRIVAIVGSPRIGGNTDLLVQEILSGAESAGAETKVFYLNHMHIKGCQACQYCKTHLTCRLDDEMQTLYREIENAQAVVIGFPIYMMQMSAQTKLFLDRLYAFRRSDGTLKLSPKDLILAATCKVAHFEVYKPYFDLLDHLFKTMGFLKLKETIFIGGLSEKGDILHHRDVLAHARNVGADLAEFPV